MSYLNNWEWNYLAPAVFHSAPLLYICKAIYPLLLSNRATYPGSHLQTAREKKKKRKCCGVLAETRRRSLRVLNCLNMHIISHLPNKACPSAKWIINTMDLMLVWKTKHLTLKDNCSLRVVRVPHGFISAVRNVFCKLMDKRINSSCHCSWKKTKKKFLLELLIPVFLKFLSS